VETVIGDDDLTHQSFKDECDITRIVETYARTGIVPGRRMEPQYGECPDTTLFEAACVQAAIRTAEADGFEYSEEMAAEAVDGPISEKEGDSEGSPEKAAPAASQAADDESSGQSQ
jgi:hypothetical protein